jgi:hypothetical protein
MKKLLIACLVSLISCAPSVLLTPELVIEGGYYPYEHINLFPEINGKEVIGNVVNCNIKEETLYNNLIAWIYLRSYKVIFDNKDKIIFSIQYPVGRENFSTPVGNFNRSQSEISFKVVVDLKDNTYRYSLEEFRMKRRMKIVFNNYLSYAPTIGFYNNINVNVKSVESEGTPNYLHWQRMGVLIAERNGYVNLVIAERKTVNKLKDRYINNIRKMDTDIKIEENLYQKEYDSVLKFIDDMNENIMKI